MNFSNESLRKYLDRNITDELERCLYEFIFFIKENEEQKSVAYRLFYLFIIKSYKTDRLNRFSVSQLGLLLKKEGIAPSEYINAYAHGLYILALKDGKEIYGGNFNI